MNQIKIISSNPTLTIAHELFNSLFIVSAGAGGRACASRVSPESVVNLLPQLLSSHLKNILFLGSKYYYFVYTTNNIKPSDTTIITNTKSYSRVNNGK